MNSISVAVRESWEVLKHKWEPMAIVVYVSLALVFSMHAEYKTVFSSVTKVIGVEILAYLYGAGVDADFIIQGALPILAILLLGGKLYHYGLGAGNGVVGLKYCALYFLLFIPCACVLLSSVDIRNYYATQEPSGSITEFVGDTSLQAFLGYFHTEFIFRGLLLFGVRRNYGDGPAIMISTIPYVLMHYEKPLLEAFGSLPVGFALAILAIKSESILYGLIIHTVIGMGLGIGVNFFF